MQSADVELKAERWQRSRKQLRASLMLMQGAPSLRDGMAEKALAEASAKAIREERERRMRNWPKGIALWKKALRLLAVERPTLWRVAELHACAEPIPDRLARVAEWYGQLVQSTPRGVIEMQTGFADGAGRTRYRPTVSHRPPPSIACARAADAAARFRIDGSPALQALLSPRTFATASYPKPSAIDVDSLQHGVWSADFSWERGVVPQCGPIDESPGFAGDAALQVWRPPPTQKPARLVLQMGNVAPCTASKPSAVAAGTSGGHRKPPKEPSRAEIKEAITRAALHQSRGLPFGKRTVNNNDKVSSMQAPPSTRYNPIRPDDKRSRAADFGAGGAIERAGACASALGSTEAHVGPGSYSARQRAGPGRAQHVRILGKPPVFSFHDPGPAAGDYDPVPPTSGRTGAFSRGKTGREEVKRAKVSTGPAPGLVAWNALEPKLVQAGVMEADTPRDRPPSVVVDGQAPTSGGTLGRHKEEFFKHLAHSLGRDPPKW